MQRDFVKYHANGNDFIVFNQCAGRSYDLHEPDVAQKLCHRQFGVGADGILTLDKQEGYDFQLCHYNADGSPGGGLCGNGSRVALHYAQHLGLIQEQGRFLAIDGPHTGSVVAGKVHVQLSDVTSIRSVNQGYFVDNGTAHYVQFVKDCLLYTSPSPRDA